MFEIFMNKTELNQLATSRVAEMFADLPMFESMLCSNAILDCSNFIATLAAGYVTIIVDKPDGFYCCRTSGNLSKLSCSTIQES